MKYSFAILLLLLFAAPTCAQSFPWADFQRRTLSELVETNDKESAEDFKRLKGQNQLIVRANYLPSVVKVTFTGESRVPNEIRKTFIQKWGEVVAKHASYSELYEREYLFREGTIEYWLPVQTPVAKYFEKEVKSGELLDLYLIRPGGIRRNEITDWVFLVEEFQKLH